MQYVNSNTRSVAINKTLSDTYKLLAMNFLFAGVTGFVGMMVNMPVLSLVAFIGAIAYSWFGMRDLQSNAKGVMSSFIYAGLIGFGIGPSIGFYLSMPGGPAIVMQAFVATAAIFAALSAYSIMSKKDFSFLSGFIIAGLVVGVVGIIASLFIQIPAFSLAISGIFALMGAALILFYTSQIVRNGETNYVAVTIGLFVGILNIFLFLLQILGMNNGD